MWVILDDIIGANLITYSVYLGRRDPGVSLVAGCMGHSRTGDGFLAAENWMGVHRAAGYGVVCLLVFRLIWAFFGSEYSRLFAILRSARRAHSHIQGLMMLRPPHHLGHTGGIDHDSGAFSGVKRTDYHRFNG
jgi:hypothetical protein